VPSLDTNYVPNSVIIQISRKLGQPSYPLFFNMSKPSVSASSWAVANPALYNSPWSYDTQNRLFSLQAWAPGKDTTFTVRYLGNPVNVAFKGKHTVSGKDEPCLCFMFPSETEDADNMVCRLLQPSNFVLLQAFEGYKPIAASVLKEHKAVKANASGGWFKKVWALYSKEEPTEYKFPQDQSAVPAVSNNTPPKPRVQQTLQQSLKAAAPGNALSDDDDLNKVEGDGKTEEEHVDVVGVAASSPKVPSVGRSTVGEKAPRFEANFSTWKGCLKFARQKMERERNEEVQEKRNFAKLEERWREAQEINPEKTLSDIDCSSASEFEFGYDSGFERMVSEEADEIFERESKKLQRSSSSGSAGSGGKGEKKKFEL